MFQRRYTEHWWFEPELPRLRNRLPSKLKDLDPTVHYDQFKLETRKKVGVFAPSRRWVGYHRLQEFDGGYIAPLYTLKQIGERYGLTVATQRYFRKFILPDPYDVVVRRAVAAHHWSRFTLMALDAVLKDLERHGHLAITKNYVDHIDLVHRGSAYLSEKYEAREEERAIDPADKFGVEWFD